MCPGSGPIDPDKILEAIHGGADHDTDHLMIGAAARWLRVDGNAWELADAVVVRISFATFSALQTADAATVDSCVRIGGDLFTLDEEEIEEKLWAVLNPA